jgi:methionyl aminopeptidase
MFFKLEVLLIELRTKHEIEALRAAAQITAQTHARLAGEIHAGIRLKDLDTIAEEFILAQGAATLYKGIRQVPNQRPFPGVICASVNNEICHGLPDGRILKEGDIVGIDIGLRYKGWCGDVCVTHMVGQLKPEVKRLVDTTSESLRRGIAACIPGNRLGAIGAAIQSYAEGEGYSVVREYGGHGIGRELWEDPFVPHIGPADRGPILKAGMVLNIEPMLNMGKPYTRLMKDEWTVVTADGSLSAQFEHTIAITENGPEVLSILS